MKKSTKAALYSGLLFPGAGLYFLKHYVRGSVFFIPALVTIVYILNGVTQVMAQFSEQAKSDPTTLLNSQSLFNDITTSLQTHMPLYNQAVTLFLLSWVISTVSSYFAGRKQEMQDSRPEITR